MTPSRDAKVMLALMWIAAAGAGVLVAMVPVVSSDPPDRVVPGLLLVVSVLFGLLRPSLPWLWALMVAWPVVVVRLSQGAAWTSVLLAAYALVGFYGGAWLAGARADRAARARGSRPDEPGDRGSRDPGSGSRSRP